MSIDGITEVANKAYELIASKEGAATSVLLVLYGIAKRVSTEKSGPVITKIQETFDLIGDVFQAIGRVCNLIGKILHDVVSSDGWAGKK